MNGYIFAIIHVFIFWGQSTIKNPKSVATERSLIQQVVDIGTELLTAIDSIQPKPNA